VATSPPALRIDGRITLLEDLPPLTATDVALALEQISTNEERTAFDREHELDSAYDIPGLARFRVSALCQRGSTSLTFRVVPLSVPTIDELGLPAICRSLIMKPRGLVLITGAAGSGKSTTLAAMISHLNETESRNIITIEDPNEFLFSNKKCLIQQRDVGEDTSSYSVALMHALRHDPDVIVIGEMRDLPTVSTAIRAAETGHLVMSTLHTIDAPQSIDRIIDMFPYGQQQQIRLQLSQVLEAVLAQTLVRRIGGGRVAAFEIMLTNSVIQRLIREDKIREIPPNIEMSYHEGMQSLEQSLAELVKAGVISKDEASMRSTKPAKLNELM
jgi:twitching motility protein PilT